MLTSALLEDWTSSRDERKEVLRDTIMSNGGTEVASEMSPLATVVEVVEVVMVEVESRLCSLLLLELLPSPVRSRV